MIISCPLQWRLLMSSRLLYTQQYTYVRSHAHVHTTYSKQLKTKNLISSNASRPHPNMLDGTEIEN